MKFGGASLATAAHFDHISHRILKKLASTSQIIVVVSAMGKTTDDLIALAQSVNPSPPQREYDMLLTVGERISMSLLAMKLASKGVPAISLTGSQAGIITCNHHTDAKILDIRPHRIHTALQKSPIVIVAGFQGVSKGGEITTLGRGGSDTSAVALGIALQAHIIEFYKDVPGFFSHDPKLHSTAQRLATLSYHEALHIVTQQDGKILHKRALEMAEMHEMPLAIFPFIGEEEGSYIGTSNSSSRMCRKENEADFEKCHLCCSQDPCLVSQR